MPPRISSRLREQLAWLAVERVKRQRYKETTLLEEEVTDIRAYDHFVRKGEWPPHFQEPLPLPRKVSYGDAVVYEGEPTQLLLGRYWIPRLRASGFNVPDLKQCTSLFTS